MKKLFIVIFAVVTAVSNIFAQSGTTQQGGNTSPQNGNTLNQGQSALNNNCNIQIYKGIDYVLDANVDLTECDAVGGDIKKSQPKHSIENKGLTFTVAKVAPNCDLIIIFDDFKTADSVTYNGRYFRLKKEDVANNFSDVNSNRIYLFQFGSFTTPFKFRPTKSLFTNNLSLGTSLSYLHPLPGKGKDWSIGFVGGISLTSVTLDSLSTNYKVKTSTDRPALTPSFSALIAYKNINITFGFGADYINRTSIVEKSWIFNGKPWIGFGIGINLFNSSNTGNSTTPTTDQNTGSKSSSSAKPTAKS